MTDIIWGEPIPVDGKRPDWLRDEVGLFENQPDRWLPEDRLSAWSWCPDTPCPVSIKLPADHPYYTVKRHNAQNGTDFTYWPGGENAPDDAVKGSVLFRSGKEESWWSESYDWRHQTINANPRDYDIIGYTRRAEPVPDTDSPAQWAVDRVLSETAGAGVTEVRAAFARYIEQHEQPPVDPDVLAVREILAAWYNDTFIATAKRVEDGDYDSSEWFLKALAAYRKHRQ